MKIKFIKEYKAAKANDCAEVSDELGEGLIVKGIAVKDEQKLVAEVDTKAMAIAISDGFKAFQRDLAPQAIIAKVEKKFGEHLADIAAGKVSYDDATNAMVRKDINITTPAAGQYATTITTYTQDIDILKPSSLASLVGRLTYTGTDNELHWNVLTSVGTAPAIVNESSLISDSQPVLTQYLIRMQKLTYLYYASKEALADTGLLTQLVNEAVSEAFTKYIELKLLSGTYATDGIDGVIGNTNTYSIAKDSGQLAATITEQNIQQHGKKKSFRVKEKHAEHGTNIECHLQGFTPERVSGRLGQGIIIHLADHEQGKCGGKPGQNNLHQCWRKNRITTHPEHKPGNRQRLCRCRKTRKRLFVIADHADIETGKPETAADHQQRTDTDTGNARQPFKTELVDQICRSGSKRDKIRERVELHAKVRGAVGNSGHKAVNSIKKCRKNDKPAGSNKTPLPGHDNGDIAAHHVHDGKNRRDKRARY